MTTKELPTEMTHGVLLNSSAHTAKESLDIAFRQVVLGDFTVTVVSDGTVARDVAQLVTKIAKHEVLGVSKKDSTEARCELAINAYLIDTGAHRILIDTGAGDLFKPEGGRLVRNLQAAGYGATTIDSVVLTHIHADHSGGLVLGGEKVFEKAKVFIPERDFNLFMDEQAMADAPERMKHIFVEARRTIGPYVDSQQVETYPWNVEVLPGITSLPAPGHTPGHSYLVVESRGQKLVVLGDTIHVAGVQFSKPHAAVILDVDQDAAVLQRKKGLEEAAAGGYLVAFSHVSFPGLGHIRKVGDGFAWTHLP